MGNGGAANGLLLLPILPVAKTWQGGVIFVLVAFTFMYFGRRAGWMLSKGLLYTAPTPLAVIYCLLWGMGTALCVRYLLTWLEPHWALRWIFGYFLGAYVSSVNFGLLDESTVPPNAQGRHAMISAVPPLVYVATSIALAFAPYGQAH